ncbi:MAG: zf-HC2 domain-containing protein [Acidobacteriota bacterium]
MSGHWMDRLSEYVDGELTPPDRAACEAHLAACAACRVEADQLRAFLAAVPAGLQETLPARDLWPGIEAAIVPARRAPYRVSFSLPQLALAASLLIAVSSSVSWLLAKRAETVVASSDAPVTLNVEASGGPDGTIVPANFADAQFDAAIADLEAILRERRQDLDPSTVMILERNLTVIDQAIREARAALHADPANPYLNAHLTDARRRKLDLLRRATTLAVSGSD